MAIFVARRYNVIISRPTSLCGIHIPAAQRLERITTMKAGLGISVACLRFGFHCSSQPFHSADGESSVGWPKLGPELTDTRFFSAHVLVIYSLPSSTLFLIRLNLTIVMFLHGRRGMSCAPATGMRKARRHSSTIPQTNHNPNVPASFNIVDIGMAGQSNHFFVCSTSKSSPITCRDIIPHQRHPHSNSLS
ncbi:hypothetical protein BKA65DRAFT_253075 [Rhexocercosporidium sp. MPI-PUGE-AT-0058]|nr:hypothetical protein BKA65DRAFT_253075 [Rhexocercosporidium sp. MPI-PUGE-AT-0058]